MKFILAIEPATENTSFGVVVPALPGCFCAGDTLDEAIQNAQEAIALHCSTLIEDGLDLPPAQTIAQHQADPEYAGWVWAVVDVPVEKQGRKHAKMQAIANADTGNADTGYTNMGTA